MEIRGSTILVLGGAGLVGKAVCRRLLQERPARLVVGDLQRARAECFAKELAAEAGGSVQVEDCWGNIFLPWELRELSWEEVLADETKRRLALADVLDPLVGERRRQILERSTLARHVRRFQPDALVDCINTATAFAYRDVYSSAHELLKAAEGDRDGFRSAVERHLTKMYTPQLVRHIQILFEVINAHTKESRPGVAAYVKVGTSGTGGMGLNIPYTHGEEKPSSVLLSKAAVAGAHSLLLFLLGRTPPSRPSVKEIKPTAAIGWASIGYGPIAIRGRPVPLYDCPPEQAPLLSEALAREGPFGEALPGRVLEDVFIDTGENGLYALGEFETLTAISQMELVTAEEAAEDVVRELEGGSTGHDVISALDQAVLGPSYRAGYLRSAALARMRRLEKERGSASVAFEALGPPRVSKLLFEAHLLKRAGDSSIDRILSSDAEKLSAACKREVAGDRELRVRMLSIGIPVLLPKGDRLLRGPLIKAECSEDGWVDLRPSNMRRWQERFRLMRQGALDEKAADADRHSSRFDGLFLDPASGGITAGFSIGEVVAWVLGTEEEGKRMKS